MVIRKINLDRVSLITNILISRDYSVGVEVGSFKGEFAKELLERWGGTLYLVDIWKDVIHGYDDFSNQLNYDFNIFEKTINNIDKFDERAVMIRTSSKNASKLFQNESLDFVYIDANHSYDSVKEDIELWLPKIKTGGILCGHDYINMGWYEDPNFAQNGKDKYIWAGETYHGIFGVNPAVDEFCKLHNYSLTLSNEWFGSWIIDKN